MGKMKDMLYEVEELRKELEKAKLQHEFEQARKYYEEEMARNVAMRDQIVKVPGNYGVPTAMERRSRPERQQSKLERLKDDLGRIDQYKADLIDIIDKFEKLPFKVGDVAIHPYYGNVLISDIFIPEERKYRVGLDSLNVDEPTAIVFIPGMQGSESLPLSELVPFNETSKVLYARK